MRISMPLQYAGDPKASVDRVVELEKAGLDTVWVAEAYGFTRVLEIGRASCRERVLVTV